MAVAAAAAAAGWLSTWAVHEVWSASLLSGVHPSSSSTAPSP